MCPARAGVYPQMTGKMLAVCGGGRVENGVGVEGTVDRKVVGGRIADLQAPKFRPRSRS